ncbi:MAG TPA: hypothetical protein VGD75_15865 [Bradyrhizobium sp.]|jgi:hypothetical protein
MANERIPNDPYRPTLDGPTDRRILGDDDLRDPARLDNELQPDPELAEGRASGGRIAMFAVAVAVVLGAVFYGLNNSSVDQAGTTPTAQKTSPSATAQNNTQPPPAPPGMRDVTPRANTEPGVTTGSAANRPPPPNPNPTDRSPQGANPFNHSEQR